MVTYTQLLNTKQFSLALEHAEREVYTRAYGYNGLNQVATAKDLGIARGTFRTKMKHWGIL